MDLPDSPTPPPSTTPKTGVPRRDFLRGLGAVSTGASFGLAGWFDMLMSPVNVNIVPFLSLGLGIDDMFVMAHTMTRYGVPSGVAGFTGTRRASWRPLMPAASCAVFPLRAAASSDGAM